MQEPPTENPSTNANRPIRLRRSGSGPVPERRIAPHKGLPSSRAVVGGLLVAVAALGTWAVTAGAGRTDPARYLVAASQIGPGERITEANLDSVAIDVPPSQRASLFADPDELADAVALGPIGPGELIQAGSVTAASERADEREISFSVDRDWAVGGRLRTGDHIDVFVTNDDADGPRSDRVLRDATVRRIDAAEGDGLGETNRQIITVGVTADDDTEALVSAARAGDLTVLRVNGESPPDPPSATKPPASSEDGE